MPASGFSMKWNLYRIDIPVMILLTNQPELRVPDRLQEELDPVIQSPGSARRPATAISISLSTYSTGNGLHAPRHPHL